MDMLTSETGSRMPPNSPATENQAMPLDGNCALAQSHLTILQGIIGRLATNSANAKTWCIALVSAILVVLADGKANQLIWIVPLPIVLLASIDAYYLGLERQFRSHYEGFVKKLGEGIATADDLLIQPPRSTPSLVLTATWKGFWSLGTCPFYFGLLAVAFAAGSALSWPAPLC